MNGFVLKCRLLFCLLSALLFIAGGAAAFDGEGVGEDGSPVELHADQMTYDKDSETYFASGKVELQKGDLRLFSDRVQWNAATREASAVGNVRLDHADGFLRGDELRINLDSGQGSLEKGEAFFRDHNFRFTGARIEKLGDSRYRAKDSTFTTCDGETPAWKFGIDDLDVTVGRYAHGRHAFFYLKDVPVFYLPYIIYPVKTERESGLLMPRYGYSKKRGAQLSMAYYHVIDRHMDATFFVDYLSDLGLGKGLEYRYILGEDNEGIFHGYHINGIDEGSDRYAFSWDHSGTLPGQVRMSADMEYVDSNDYFDDFGEVAEEYNKEEVQSVLYLNRPWGKLNLTGQFKYTKDLEQDNDQTLQRLPDINLALIRSRLGATPFYFQWDSTSTYFWRREGLKGERLDLRPSLSAVFKPGSFLEIVPEMGYRERLYWTSSDGPGYEREGLYDFSTRISTSLSRVFDVDGESISKIRHYIEPEILYSYIPDDDQSHLPFFEDLDRIEPENLLSYALVNRLTARYDSADGPATYRELLYLRLSQSYDIRQERHERKDQTGIEPFSDLRAEMILHPTPSSFLDLDTRYDFHERVLDTFNLEAGLQSDEENKLSLNYRYTRNEQEYLAGTLETDFLKPVYVNYQHRYDLQEQRTLENVLSFEYRSQCWSVFLTYRDRLDDREYFVTFALSGLGKVAQFGGSLGGGE